jgi:predicted GNAT family acetyltransferase
MSDAVKHDEDGRRGVFFIERDGRRVAEMTYQREGVERAIFDHTEVDPALRGQGVARTLFDAAVAWARGNGIRIVPVCSYVRAQFARNASLADVLGEC